MNHAVKSVPLASDSEAPSDLATGTIATLMENATAEDIGTGDIADSIALLKSTSLWTDDGTNAPASTARHLMQLGGANLSVGRLIEGHVNGLYLIRTHGHIALQSRVDALVKQGAMLGVWGADGPAPLVVSANGAMLQGGKTFASGLGVVTHAVASVGTDAGARLALIDVTDKRRQDASTWQMQGMKATVSGNFDFDGIPVRDITWIGNAGDYFKEPHFVGGVWRIAALQTGGAVGLLERAAAQLRELGRMGAEAQHIRLGRLVTRALGAAALTQRAAGQVVSLPPDQAVATSIAARLLTEDVALDTIRGVQQSLGLGHFRAGSETDRMVRDLSVYLRQAAGDAMLLNMSKTSFEDAGSLWRLIP
ncbi:MAG: acyl-CoA dehydrogenase [Rhodobacterales bacterium]|nr:acyl-CoA dehydrogenase [Rhodobacterales bacterium]